MHNEWIRLILTAMVLAQAVYWVLLKLRTESLDDEYYEACVHPGGKGMNSTKYQRIRLLNDLINEMETATFEAYEWIPEEGLSLMQTILKMGRILDYAIAFCWIPDALDDESFEACIHPGENNGLRNLGTDRLKMLPL